jgi:polynucleotide 5'-hydroxyl-kinase GRC3/NOL9
MTTPKSSPSHYVASIQSLLETYHLDVQTRATADSDEDIRISDTIPLIVNTMGWTKGLGADLTRKIEDLVQPSDIFEVEAPPFEYSSTFDNPPGPLSDVQSARLHRLLPIPPSVLSTNYSASDHRSIAVLSYLHAIFPRMAPGELQQITAAKWNTSLPLCAYPPYEVDWSLAFDKVALCGAGDEDVVSSEIDRVLNGALVGLVACEPGSLDSDINVAGNTDGTIVSAIPYEQGSAAPSPSTSICYGLGLIRAISPSSSHMHIITPVPPYLFSKCRVLVKGEMELPVWGMLDFRGDDEGEIAGVDKTKVPYLQWGKGEGLGGEKRRVRRNLMRKGQM